MNCCCWADLRLGSNGKVGGWLAVETSCDDGGIPWWRCVGSGTWLNVPGSRRTRTGRLLDVFPPEKIGKVSRGVSESVGAGLGSGAAGIGLPFASKTAMVIGEKRGVGT